ncbi:MAG: hypothetical protein OEW39_06875 [Deltaproteobacteria bacterium]|nr:hypothetical protein [Deltaproteobacteria bacterium]
MYIPQAAISASPIPASAPESPRTGNGPAFPTRLLTGDHTALHLAHQALAGRVRLGAAPVVVDCGGVLDVYHLGTEARRLALTPAEVLAPIQVCRAFTGYQEVSALLRLRRQFPPGTEVFLLCPLPPLLDEDLPAEDRPWLFRRLLDGLRHLAAHGYAVRVCQPALNGRAGAQGERFLNTLARRLPLSVARQGRILGMNHGKERDPLFTGGGPGAGLLHGLPPGLAPGRPTAIRPVI